MVRERVKHVLTGCSRAVLGTVILSVASLGAASLDITSIEITSPAITGLGASVSGGWTAPFYAAAASPVVSLVALPLSADRVEDQRLVTFFFSEGAWGGVPFSEAQKQQVMVEAMLSGEIKHLEAEVTHLLSAPEARVRRFTAVFEVDGSARPPVMRSGYELELLVPHSHQALSVELENAETGVVNRVEVEPDGAL